MSGLSASVDGADRLDSTLSAAGREIEDLSGVHRDAGRLLLNVAVIPRDTGYLEQTTSVDTTRDGFVLAASAPYAGYVHAVNPFFTRAIEAQADAVADLYLDHVEDALTQVEGT